MTTTRKPGLSRRSTLALMGAGAATFAAPWVARADANILRIGMQSILSGPIALLGNSSRNALMMEQDRINAAGGFLGRQIEFLFRDSKGQPQESARIARELVNSSGCELLVDSEASSGAFAVQEVIRDLGNVVCIHTNSETSALTADPKIRAPTAFRVARQGVHDAVAGSIYLADFSKARKLNKWATCSPDYAYGRDTTAQYLQFLKQFNPDIEVVTDAWPKLGQPDFTEVITKLIQAKPQALFTLLYAGDLSAFVNQANVYALFSQMTVATPNVDYPVMAAIKNLPAGIQSATRYLETFPDTPANKEWGEAYHKRWNERPTTWSWQCTVAMQFYEAGIKKANTLEAKALSAALTGLKINTPFGADGTITMRDDHTTINYAIGWGQTTPKEPFMVDIKPADWGKIIELETEWKKQQKYI
ncbi:ABC transporter substrate-binding protein [Bradyrhizobium sp. S69]|uniref:ABC transporter substrate-binding protein n=1 Tax=Bradyrhizobium sp. S69 TaxID=1641856 RepID=UPI00131BE36B|nr:ABC transporter substrate-binding protein [Bradyrhizobium sp. S69]